MVRYCAAVGSVLVEVIDDVLKGKVYANIVWPGLVFDLSLDSAGNVKAYTLQYRATDENGIAYTYRKEVDGFDFRTFRDGNLFDFTGFGAVVPNPYGFVPAVWAKHIDLGGIHGAPVIHASLGKIDELNSLMSHAHDQVHKAIASPMIIASVGGITNLIRRNVKRGPTEDLELPSGGRESALLLKAPADTKVLPLLGSLDLSAVQLYAKSLIFEIEQDHPELSMWSELRKMSVVTGPGASRMLGDVVGPVTEAQALYDQQTKKLLQMAVAISGWRANSGIWELNRQQAKFLPFGLESFLDGELDFDIEPRALIPPTSAELLQIELQKVNIAQAKKNLEAPVSPPTSGGPSGAPTGVNRTPGNQRNPVPA